IWGNGFWNLLAFSMQMALVLVTGHALATSGPVKNAMKAMASVANTPAQGVMLVTFVSAVACIINWGFGLVLGAMFAREVARRIPKSDYSLLIACAYIGFLTWHGGLSGSVPLIAATPGNPMEKTAGLIPVAQTLWTNYNLFITLALVITLPFLTRMMMKPENEVVAVDPKLLKEEEGFQRVLGPNASVAERMEESRILGFVVALSVFGYLGIRFAQKGVNIDINTVNLAFLGAGMLLHKTPMAYARAIGAAAKGTSGIMIQFPFYAGIQLMMEHSGLGGIITNWFVHIATKDTFPLMAFFSSALINFAVPSGGGHWVVQGPFVIPAAQALGADLGKSAMAIAYGEAWMNMAQPFWALPALAIAGLGVRDIMGYCVTALLFSGAIFVAGMYLF
ncbi:MAG: short-chain fatty acid transporter, partial [Betaproteobacteria bacterium]